LSNYDYNTLERFWNIVKTQIIIKGIPDIMDISLTQETVLKFKENGDIEKPKQFIVTTSGINLVDLRFVKGIDHNKTICNDIETIHKLYGIEAARTMLFNQLRDSYGDGLGNSHFSILVDVMTHTGTITSIDRHGMSRLETDPLARASFEKQMEHLLYAAIFNETDHMRSVSSRVMVGRCIRGGTGIFDLMLDTELLENSEYTSNETGGYIHMKPIEEDVFMNDINNKTDIDDLFIPE